MLFNPSILALLIVSSVVSLMMILAGTFSLQVIRHWDINSGSQRQLNLEHKTYLISTLVAFCFVAELISLLLFIYNAEQMHTQFVGAMCATGVLNVDPNGWPTLYLKVAIFFSGATWLIMNRTDNKAHDYPLIRVKYIALLLIIPLIIAEAIIQTRYFLGLDPDVITSCCGALFTPESEGVAAEISSLDPLTAIILLLGSAIVTIAIGVWYLINKTGGIAFAVSNITVFLIALVAIVSCVALYIYEHPHHHCPLCILKGGHDFMGYFLYIPLFIATSLALGVGSITPFKNIGSLKEIITNDSRYLIGLSLIFLLVFYLVAAYAIFNSNLSMIDVWW